VDGALRQLSQATTDDPKDASSLFNLGMIRWKGKKDSKGALATWAQLLKANPALEPAKKEQVEKLMAEVRQGSLN
jgi:cytochrome c-type biogenesis protein CcmH/NrfG